MGGYFEKETVVTEEAERAEDSDGVDNNEILDASDETETDENEVVNNVDNNLIFVSAETFERFASVFAFFLGMMVNWGSLNLLGFMIGLNYNYFVKQSSYVRIKEELQTIIPTFTLGVLLVHLSVIYFCVSVFIGYMVKSKNLAIPDKDFFKKHNVVVDVKNYRSVFYEILGIVGDNLKKE
tara:strand:+ start:62 stop:604 length:543 start_codon:yes stop_codon:yes gene_type:complete